MDNHIICHDEKMRISLVTKVCICLTDIPLELDGALLNRNHIILVSVIERHDVIHITETFLIEVVCTRDVLVKPMVVYDELRGFIHCVKCLNFFYNYRWVLKRKNTLFARQICLKISHIIFRKNY